MEKSSCFGQTRTTGFIWSLLAALLLWHSPASAEDYYWIYTGSSIRGDSAFDACNKAAIANRYSGGRLGALVPDNTPSFECFFRSSSGGEIQKNNVLRYGVSCREGTEYKPEAGECVAPEPPEEDKCLPTYGNPLDHEHYLGPIVLGVFPESSPPAALCKDSCQYDGWELIRQPYRYQSGTPPGAFSAYRYFGNGQQCTAGDAEASAPGAGEAETEKNNKCDNKVCLTSDENGVCQQYTYSCEASETHTEPPTGCDFGKVNGEPVCVPNSPGPKLTEKDVKTDVEEKINEDGSKDTTTTTTTTTTNCNGEGSCSTSTTTNVNNKHTNADGSDGGESSTCTGPDCKDPSGKSPNDKKQEQQEKEENESKVSGDASCAAVPSCTGDAIQCAILRQTHTQRCADEKFQEVDAEELVAGVTGDMSGEGFQPFGEGERGNFDLAGMIDTSSTIGGSCPALPPITFTIRGVTKSVEFGTVMAEICKYASWFSFLMVAFAMRRAAEIVAGGMA
ncbi:hypothetical protein [Stutzerimonas nitrititolerans]|uniref:hypothetical protein n=1 Tax=Stutzerimonas nitrititolerans TaxID=2482751 RepID=UPI0028A8B229|nr:hypothetical protein [Stutzerimonas nitrititolerans]